MRLAQPQVALPLALEARSARELLKQRCQAFVELDQQLRAHVTRNSREPLQFPAQLRQLVDLVKRRVVAAFSTRSSEPLAALFMREVPQKPQRRLPRFQLLSLRSVRIHAVAICLSNKHPPTLPDALRTTKTRSCEHDRKTRGFLPALKDGVSAPKIG